MDPISAKHLVRIPLGTADLILSVGSRLGETLKAAGG